MVVGHPVGSSCGSEEVIFSFTGHRTMTRPLSLQLLVDGSVTTAVLENLHSQTEYVISVYSVVGQKSSEPLRGTETTREFE